MKKLFLLWMFCLYGAIGAYAQVPDCSSAIEIPADGTTIHFSPSSSPYVWYRFEAEAGAYYEIDGSRGAASFDVYVNCPAPSHIETGWGRFAFRIENAGTYYIRTRSTTATNWTLKKMPVSTNTTCALAETVYPGVQANGLHGTDTDLWYRISLTAGVWYQMSGSNAYEVYAGCGEASPVTSGNAYDIFTVDVSGDYYIKWTGSGSNYWTYMEMDSDYPACQNAESISVGATVQTTGSNLYKWYSVEVEPGKYYEINVNHPSLPALYVLNQCDGGTLTYTREGKAVFLAEGDATYYIRANATNYSFEWSIEEISYGGASCNNAMEVVPGNDAIFNVHTSNNELWYKFEAEEGQCYTIGGYNSFVVTSEYAVFYDCHALEYPVLSGSGNEGSFIAGGNSTYYIRFRSSGNYAWRLRKAEGGTACGTAVQIPVLGTSIYTEHANLYQYRWYRFEAQPGKYYEIDGSASNTSFDIFTDCSGNQIGAGSGKFILKGQDVYSQTYFIRCRVAGVSTTGAYGYNWTIREVNSEGGAECSAAGEIIPGNTYRNIHEGNNARWYRFTGVAGRDYLIAGGYSGAGLEIYDACDAGTPVFTGSGTSNKTFSASADAVYYMKWSGNEIYYTWTFSEQDKQEVCREAVEIQVAENIHTNPTASGYSWYKFSAEEGKTYEIDATGLNATFSIYVDCDVLYALASTSTANTKIALEASSDALYYIRCYNSSGQAYDWILNETTAPDNFSCDRAAQLAANGDLVSNYHYRENDLWYKFDAEAGKYYRINTTYSSSSSSSSGVRVYTGCDQVSTPVAEGNRSVNIIFRAEADAAYYIRWIGSGNYDWTMSTVNSDNSDCASAVEVPADGSNIIGRHTENSELWYKFQATEGTSYTVTRSASASFEFYTACGQSSPAASNNMFQTQSTGEHYIKWTYTGNLVWTLIEMNDNRFCQNATEIPGLGIPVSTKITDNYPRWYKFEAEAGATYVINGSFPGGIYIYSDCNSNQFAGGSNINKITFRTEEADTYYIQWSAAIGSGSTWTIDKIENNSSCQYAEPVQPGITVSNDHIGMGNVLWYQFEAQAGKYYSFETEDGNAGVEVYTACGGAEIPVSGGNLFSSKTFHTATAGTYYIRWNSAHNLEWKLVEVTGNTVCLTAESITLGTTVQTNPPSDAYLWYKFNAQAGKYYEIDASDAYAVLAVFADCDQDWYLFYVPGSKGILKAENTAPYYILVGEAVGSFEWTVKELNVTENFTCSTATEISANGNKIGNYMAGRELWYKFTVEAGKYYEVDADESYSGFHIYDACGSPTPVVSGDDYSRTVFRATANTTYYIQWNAPGEEHDYAHSYTWRLRQLTLSNNHSCDVATQAAIDGQEIINFHIEDNDLWYKFNATAGKYYEIWKSSYSSSYSFEIYTVCGSSSPIATGDSRNESFYANASATYYIKWKKNYWSDDDSYGWWIFEASGNSICDLAQTVTVGTTVNVTDQTLGRYLWYKFETVEGKAYEIDATQVRGELALYGDCGGYELKYIFNEKYVFQATKTGTYYVSCEGAGSFSWKVSEFTDATLSSLTVNGISVPGFSPTTTSYTMTPKMPYITTQVTLSGTATNPSATITGNGVRDLSVGNNALNLAVTSSLTSLTYTVNVYRKNNATDVSSITVNGQNASYDEATSSYQVEVSRDTEQVTIEVSPADPNATTTGQTGTHAFTGDESTFMVGVIAEDDAYQQSYTVKVTRSDEVYSNDASLSSVTVDGNAAVLKDGSTSVYQITVGHTTAIVLAAQATDDKASIRESDLGEKTVQVGLNTFEISVTAEDGTVVVYTLEITVEPESTTGFETPAKPLATLYPNPTDGLFILNFDTEGTYRVTITTLTGKVMSQQVITGQLQPMDISSYPAGVYLVIIDNGTQRSTVKIVKN